MRLSVTIFTLAIVTSAVLTIGCNNAEPMKAKPAANATDTSHNGADPDDVPITEADIDMPKSFPDAVSRVEGYRDKIRTAVEAKTPSKAHRSLDELDIVLGKLTEIARDSGVPKDAWETVNTAGRELRDRFNEVHSAIDEKREPDYQAVAKPIDEAIEQLRAIAEKETSDASPTK